MSGKPFRVFFGSYLVVADFNSVKCQQPARIRTRWRTDARRKYADLTTCCTNYQQIQGFQMNTAARMNWRGKGDSGSTLRGYAQSRAVEADLHQVIRADLH